MHMYGYAVVHINLNTIWHFCLFCVHYNIYRAFPSTEQRKMPNGTKGKIELQQVYYKLTT